MRMHKGVILFCCVWIGGVLLASAVSIFAQVSAGQLSASGLIPFAMLLLAYVLITGGFKYESTQSKKFLKTIFEAEEVNKQ